MEYTAEHVLIAVGGRPAMPDIPGTELCIDRYHNNYYSFLLLTLVTL